MRRELMQVAVHDLVIAAAVGSRRGVRHPADARRRPVRNAVRPPAASAGTAAAIRRRHCRAAGDGVAAGDVVRPRRAASHRRCSSCRCDGRDHLRAQDACLDRFARLGIPRRPVLRLAAAWRARWPIARRSGSPPWPGASLRSGRLCDHRPGRAVGLGDRRAADHDLHRAGDHRRSMADHSGADRGHHLRRR